MNQVESFGNGALASSDQQFSSVCEAIADACNAQGVMWHFESMYYDDSLDDGRVDATFKHCGMFTLHIPSRDFYYTILSRFSNDLLTTQDMGGGDYLVVVKHSKHKGYPDGGKMFAFLDATAVQKLSNGRLGSTVA